MIPVPSFPGHVRPEIPATKANQRITAEILQAKGACGAARVAFREKFPNGCTYVDLRRALLESKHHAWAVSFSSWEDWLRAHYGGDTVVGTHAEPAVAKAYNHARNPGGRSVAVAGSGGTAEAPQGVAVSGADNASVLGLVGVNLGPAGTVQAGENGVAVAYVAWGKASAGPGGVLVFLRSNDPPVVARVGENGIQPDVLYSLNTDNQIVEAHPVGV